MQHVAHKHVTQPFEATTADFMNILYICRQFDLTSEQHTSRKECDGLDIRKVKEKNQVFSVSNTGTTENKFQQRCRVYVPSGHLKVEP